MPPVVTWDNVEREIRKHSYGIIATLSKNGRPHSTGILYAVSPKHSSEFSLYSLTKKRSKKARNIAANPNVSFTIPVPHRLFWFFPPNSIQFQGKAMIVTLDDSIREAFSKSLALKETLKSAGNLEGPDGSSFVRIDPDPVVFTYGLGLSAMELGRKIRDAAARVERKDDQGRMERGDK